MCRGGGYLSDAGSRYKAMHMDGHIRAHATVCGPRRLAQSTRRTKLVTDVVMRSRLGNTKLLVNTLKTKLHIRGFYQ